MRIVIDTNIVLDLLVFDDPDYASLLAAVETGKLQWKATSAMREELARVLGYRLVAERLVRNGRDAEDVLAAFDRHVQPVLEVPPRAPCLCSDSDDQIFVDLAVAQGARLLSKDRALLEMRKQLATLGVDVSVR